MRVSLSLVMMYNIHVQKHSKLTIYSDLSLSFSLSRYDAQNACKETLDTDKLFGPLSPSLSRYDVQHECTEIFDTDNIFGHLSLSEYDVQHACTETFDTDNTIGPLSFSLSL